MTDQEKRGRGRPRAKKSDPSYTTLTAYVKLSTFKEFKKRCIDLDMEMSEVVQALLDEWLQQERE